jgi:hypothetical protein
MIHAAIFRTTDPTCRTGLVISGSRKSIELNTPQGGCWRQVPPGCASVADVPPLGELAAPKDVSSSLSQTGRGTAESGGGAAR